MNTLSWFFAELLQNANVMQGEQNWKQKASFVLLPRKENAKLIIPTEINKRNIDTALELWPTPSLKSRIQKKITSVLGGKIGYLYNSRSTINGKSHADIARSLYEYLTNKTANADSINTVAIRLNTRNGQHRYIFQFQDRYCNASLYIKVGVGETDKEKIGNEATFLEKMSSFHSHYIIIPKVLSLNRIDGFLSVEMSALHPLSSNSVIDHEQLFIILEELHNYQLNNSAETRRDDFNPLLDRLRVEVDESTLRSLEINSRIIAHSVQRYPICHGDFARWNVFRTLSGKVGIIDWEEARETCLPLYDFFHFFLYSNLHEKKINLIDYYRKITKRSHPFVYLQRKLCTAFRMEQQLCSPLLLLYLADRLQRRIVPGVGLDSEGQKFMEFLKWLIQINV